MSPLVVGETNLVMARAMDQSDRLNYLVSLAQSGKIVLAVPECAWQEARGSLLDRWRKRRAAFEGVLPVTNDIARSGYAQPRIDALRQHVHGTLGWLREMEEQVDQSLDAFARTCLTLRHTPEAMMRGRLRHSGGQPPFKLPDCELFECLLQFLDEHASEYTHALFVTLDREDFDHPDILAELTSRRTELLFSIGDCLARLRDILLG